jgi:membrane associated rhomboid family serine protease
LNPLAYFRIFGHVLGHANIQHYVSNFLIILLVGPMLEERYGGKAILIMSAITALITGALFLLFSAPNTGLLGASGIVFMFILLSSFANFQRGRLPVTLIFAILIYLGREIISEVATTFNLAEVTNISYMTHIIGGVCGAVFGFVINKRKQE